MKRTLAIAAAASAAVLAPAAYGQPEPRNLTIDATPTTVKFGATVTLAGKLTGPNNDNRPVNVEHDPFPIDAFTNAGTATTNTTGDWSLILRPDRNTRYRARSGSAESNKTVDVMVRPAISLRLSDRTPAAGTRVTFSGRLCPEHDGVAIALQRRFGTTWRTLRNVVLKDLPGSTCSSYSRALRPRRDGAFRTRFLGDTDHVAGNSRVKRVNVH